MKQDLSSDALERAEIENRVSIATERNFLRLNKDISTHRFSKRANKRDSNKQILPKEYFKNTDNISFFFDLVKEATGKKIPPRQMISNLVFSLFVQKGLIRFHNDGIESPYPYVLKFLNALRFDPKIGLVSFPSEEEDPIGICYQMILKEGTKNKLGSYYTPQRIVDFLISDIPSLSDKTFCDPCCGTGAFLISLFKKGVSGKRIHGFDIDPIAVMIARANMFCLDPTCDFTTQIKEEDFLETKNQRFDFFATNPPWGAMKGRVENENLRDLKDKETFSLFLKNCLLQLKDGGELRFVLPISLLNVKAHKDIRSFIVEHYNLQSVEEWGKCFSGVLSDVITLGITKKKQGETFLHKDKQGLCSTVPTRFIDSKSHVIPLLEKEDLAIIDKIKNKGKYDLRNCTYALGVVTGGNKDKIKPRQEGGLIPIFKGSDVGVGYLKNPTSFIDYRRADFQQVAPDRYLFAKEKLIYRFISRYLIVAYDLKGSLPLNSANILLKDDRLPLSTACLMALLNSAVMNFYFMKMINQIKVLKEDLSRLPIPPLTSKQQNNLERLVQDYLSSSKKDFKPIDKFFFDVYGFDDGEQKIIEEATHGRFR